MIQIEKAVLQNPKWEIRADVKWCQRSDKEDPSKNLVLLTIDLPNVNGPSGLDLQAEYMLFNAQTGKNGEDEYVVDLKFFKPISPSHTKIFFTPTSLCLLLRKADAGEEYWPRLREGANEFKWLERDAEKWVVQADQNESNRIDESGFVSINTPNLGRPPPGMMCGMPPGKAQRRKRKTIK